MPNYEEGTVILINKPLHWTSFDVVKKIRFALKIKKIGHAGTLDPLATGLLVLCTGKLTKTIDSIQNGKKTYVCSMVFGKSTPSIDLETEFDQEMPWSHIDKELLLNTLELFKGEIEQIPPAHSAISINGVRAYTLARKGEEVLINPRKVTIYKLELLETHLPEIKLLVECSKGTYIRSLVRDLGIKLNSCAYMSALCRTQIGDYSNEDALSPQEYIDKAKASV